MGVWGAFPFHNEKAGGGGVDVSITSLQYFLFYGLDGGWQIGIGPMINHDWKAGSDDARTVPFGVRVAKTAGIGKQMVKLNAGIEKDLVAPDAFASDWKFTIPSSPVISNLFRRYAPTPEGDAAMRAAVLAPIR